MNNMPNIFTVPDGDDVLAELSGLTDQLWTALESATAIALAYFDDEQRTRDGIPVGMRRFNLGVHAHLTRYNVLDLLDAIGIRAQGETGTLPFDRIGLANEGICLRQARFVIRVRKADDGRLPPPNSVSQEAFYAQQMAFPFNIIGVDVPDDVVNLIVLWGLCPEKRTLRDLVLACPRDSTDAYWYRRVPHPAMVMQATRTRAGTEDDFPEIIPARDDAEHAAK